MIDYFGTDLELKSVSVPQRLITGYAAVHHSVDRVKDIIDPSASAKAVARLSAPSDVAVFVGHDSAALPIGIPQKIEATNQGLHTETYILKGPAGDNLLAVAKDLMDHGQTLGMSIGYKTRDSRSETAAGKKIRRLMDYDLKEFSYAASQAIAHPEALVSAVKSRHTQSPERDIKTQYRVEQNGQQWLVMADADTDGDLDDSRLIGTYDSQERANDVATALRLEERARIQDDDAPSGTSERQAADKTAGGAPAAEVKATWDAAYVNTLEDSCFLYIEDGGKKDDDGKTVPRSLRHFPYKDADGKIDLPHLRNAIARIPQSTLPDDVKTRLQARARRLLDQAQSGGSKTLGTAPPPEAAECEPPEWKSGAPLALYGLGVRLCDLAEQLAAEFKAMETLGEETKDYQRVRAPLRAQARAVASELGKLLDFAEAIERGDDGRQRVAWYRAQLALSDV